VIHRRTYIAFVSLSVLASILHAAPLQKFQVQNAVLREAVCNDGSPAVYYFRKGSGQGSDNWVIFLGGGGLCYSVRSCNERQIKSPELMTSNDKPTTFDGEGILSDSAIENPDFFNANHVAIPYCSSDLWSGNREQSQATGGYEFRGRRILRAVIGDLKKRNGNESLFSAKRILLSGTSAGGFGVMVHLDWLARQFPSANVRGVNDAGWTPEEILLFPDTADSLITDTAINLWSGRPDTSCSKANPHKKFLCYSSAVYPYLKTPLFVQMSQYDAVFLSGIGVRAPFDARETFLADLFAASLRESLEPVGAAFSPRTHTHGLLPYDKFLTVQVDGHSVQELLGNWFFGRFGPVKAIKQ
jgi:O-palmitoleoyl-L-serine hydrolase